MAQRDFFAEPKNLRVTVSERRPELPSSSILHASFCSPSIHHSSRVQSLLHSYQRFCPLIKSQESRLGEEPLEVFQELTAASLPKSLQAYQYAQRLHGLHWLSQRSLRAGDLRPSIRFRMLRIAARHSLDLFERYPLGLHLKWASLGIKFRSDPEVNITYLEAGHTKKLVTHSGLSQGPTRARP